MKWLSILTCLLSFQTSIAQKDGRDFKNMVDKLLTHSVPEVYCTDTSSVQPDIIYLDARELEEFRVSHLKSAQYVGYDDFDIQAINGIPKNHKIIVYCSVGYRSEKIAEQLIDAGYTNVANMAGGIFGWVNKGLPTYDSLGQTDNIHSFNKQWGKWLKKGKKVY